MSVPLTAAAGLTFLTPALAQEIAGDTSAIIGLNIIITDADGIVIGGGDQSRVGTFHEASVEVVRVPPRTRPKRRVGSSACAPG